MQYLEAPLKRYLIRTLCSLLLAGTLAANAHAVTGDVATPATNAPAVAAPANATAEPGIVVAVNPQPLPPRRRMR